ncbi:hypothetical protein [Pseudomonas anguilliseptica]|uniref:hypothetical protein n=1 Tax=Pseudomonas anguilliseptica TaxID=53406 RepID=UPI001F2678EC|nr:hypothetical protein [Pseudomonas anguilliseptica]MCE5365114.1 hypothetical protein [Pseudomonas anguilliseptica]
MQTPLAVVAGQKLGFALLEVLKELVDVHQGMTANVDGWKGGYVAHAKHNGFALGFKASQAGEFFTGAEWGKRHDNLH